MTFGNYVHVISYTSSNLIIGNGCLMIYGTIYILQNFIHIFKFYFICHRCVYLAFKIDCICVKIPYMDRNRNSNFSNNNESYYFESIPYGIYQFLPILTESTTHGIYFGITGTDPRIESRASAWFKIIY